MTVSTNQINLPPSRLSHTPVLSSIFEGYCIERILNYVLLSKCSLEILFSISRWVSADSAAVCIERVEN